MSSSDKKIAMNNKNRLSNYELENDDMNIKSHLNTSLDFSGICVSEDLINRTLEAIKQNEANQPKSELQGPKLQSEQREAEQQQSEQQETIKKDRKIIPWSRYSRRIAGVAAAVFVVAAGLNIINNVQPNSKNSTTSMDSMVAEDSSADGTADFRSTEEEAGLNSETGLEESQAVADINDSETSKYSIASDTDTAEDASVNSNQPDQSDAPQTYSASAPEKEDVEAKSITEATPDTSETETVTKGMLAGNAGDTGDTTDNDASDTLGTSQVTDPGDDDKADPGITATLPDEVTYVTFQDIFLSDPLQALSIRIVDETNKTEITLTSQEDIQSFYSMMEQYEYESGADASSVLNYTVEVVSVQQEEVSYTMTIGDSIAISCATEETVSQSTYNVSDSALLITNFDEFFLKYNQ